jgi:ribosomal biogenesis protein LAS1
MKPAFLIWDRVLQAIAVSRQACYPTLLSSMLDQITEAPGVDGPTKSKKNALLQWLVHMLTSASWVAISQPSEHVNTNIMESCLLNPNIWTQKLAKIILDRSEEDFQRLWGPMYEASLLDAQDSLVDTLPTENSIGKTHQAGTTFLEADIDDETSNRMVLLPDYSPSVNSRDFNSTLVSIPQSHNFNFNEGSGWTLWEGPWIPKPIGM